MLTLPIDEFEQDVYVTRIHSPLLIHELIYFINNNSKVNYTKERNPFKIKRKEIDLSFDWYSFINHEEFISCIISNVCYEKDDRVNENLLFSSQTNLLEKKHFLMQKLKKYNYFILSPTAENNNLLHTKNHTVLEQSVHLNQFKKNEKQLFENIFYEKQG